MAHLPQQDRKRRPLPAQDDWHRRQAPRRRKRQPLPAEDKPPPPDYPEPTEAQPYFPNLMNYDETSKNENRFKH